MKLTQWLRTIFLFPAMLMLGGLDAGAEPDTDTAEDQGVSTGDDSGAEPEESQAAESDPDVTTESTDEEAAAADEVPNPDRGAHQKTLEERAAEIAEQKVQAAIAKMQAEQAEIARQTQERLEAEKKPFVDLSAEQTRKLNDDYTAAVSRKLELEELIRLGDHSAILELKRTEKWIHDTEAWFSDNEAKKEAWQKQQDARTRQQQEAQERSNRLATTAEVFREAHNIPPEVWEQSAAWFNEQLKTDKVLGLKFAEAYRLHGDVAAVEFAHKHCLEQMGKSAAAAVAQKQEAKQKLAPGVTSVAAPKGPDLELLKQRATETGSEEDYMKFVEAKRALTQARAA